MVGDGAKIGSGSVVIKPVPDGATVVGIPGRVVDEHHKPLLDLQHGNLPDPVADAIRLVLNEQAKLEERIIRLKPPRVLKSPAMNKNRKSGKLSGNSNRKDNMATVKKRVIFIIPEEMLLDTNPLYRQPAIRFKNQCL
jgi:hypothetical protein